MLDRRKELLDFRPGNRSLTRLVNDAHQVRIAPNLLVEESGQAQHAAPILCVWVAAVVIDQALLDALEFIERGILHQHVAVGLP
jgi:hypothetical protein